MVPLRGREPTIAGPSKGSRRAFLSRLVAISAGLSGPGAPAFQQSPTSIEVSISDEVDRVNRIGRSARLGAFSHSTSEHFLGIGDAPDLYRQSALRHCEALGEAFLAHFRSRGFEVNYPKRHLTVITLKDADSYGAFLGEAQSKEVGGHFDLDTNRLVIFDFRPGEGENPAGAKRVNLFTLVHETAHQLCFNAGLLETKADVPVCISEGLATYVEMWRPAVKNAIGGVNRPRLEALVQGDDWIPIGDLLNADRAFREPATEQLAYAECWVLMYWLLRSRTRWPATHAYLLDLKTPRKDNSRTRTAEKSLGLLAKLDRNVKAEARKLVRG